MIWRLANELERTTVDRLEGTEWVCVNLRGDASARFQKWLNDRPVAPENPIFMVRDVREVSESNWSRVLTEWPSVLVEGSELRIISQDFSWILVFKDIGVAAFGTTDSA